MNITLGRMFVLLGLAAAVYGALVGFRAGYAHNRKGVRWATKAAYVFAAAMIVANGVMIKALLEHDFSVSYVAQVGSRATPTWVTIVSLWSSLEGSILFWGAILGCYVAAFAYAYRNRYATYMGYALGAVLAVSAFFAFLIAGPANPFGTVSPVPPDGPGPNALLQNHILMSIHPPMLYLGYVGMSVPFAIAVAALLRGHISDGWLKPLRTWTLVPWMFLSIGIALGGWWAYEVLGWGGYWAWDPVENASFLPWLAATGYLHSTVVQERKRMLKAWTLSLVLGAFLLTILGTFMTRSGVFNSVHSFTQSSIGPIFLGFLGVVLIISLGLVAGRSHLLEAEGRVESPLSRESAFLLNNLVFAVLTFTVLLGTVFPLLTEAIKGTKVSVGEPYFNKMAVPLGMLLVFLMGVGPALPWGKAKPEAIWRTLAMPVVVGIVVVLICITAGLSEPLPIITFGLCGFAMTVTCRELLGPGWQRAQQRKEPFAQALARSFRGNKRRMGGYIVHVAVIIIVAAIAGSSSYRQSVEASLLPGEQVKLGDFTISHVEVTEERLPHRDALVAVLQVKREDGASTVVSPKLNFYPNQREPIGTPHVHTFGVTDFYVSLLSADRETDRVGVKLYTIPLVPWIWWSLPLIALGSLVSLWPRRKARPAPVSSEHVVAS